MVYFFDCFHHFWSDGHQKFFGKDFGHTWGSWPIVFGSFSVSGKNNGGVKIKTHQKLYFLFKMTKIQVKKQISEITLVFILSHRQNPRIVKRKILNDVG